MTDSLDHPRSTILRMQMSEFWSGDLGLTLVTISLIALILVIYPLRAAGLPGRFFFDLLILTLMVSGSLRVDQSRIVTAFVITLILAGAAVSCVSWFYSTPFIEQLSSAFSIVTALLYVRIVLYVMFRAGPVTWSRIQGGICAYLLLGLTWAPAFRLTEQLHAGSFHFVSPPVNLDQLTSKLVYFSFSTLTTVGFGDVTPLAPFARSLSIAEAIVGQLFPAVLIGALVAMAMQSRPNS
jgi:Ion channel